MSTPWPSASSSSSSENLPKPSSPFDNHLSNSPDYDDDQAVEDLTSGEFTRRLGNPAGKPQLSNPNGDLSRRSPVNFDRLSDERSVGRVTGGDRGAEEEVEASLDVQELIQDLELLLKKIRLTARQENKSTTALGLGRFLLKLASGNPLSAAIDAVMTRQTALSVGDRLNTLMETELLVANLEQFVRAKIKSEEGRIVLDPTKFIEKHRADLLHLLLLGASPPLLARLLGITEGDLDQLNHPPKARPSTGIESPVVSLDAPAPLSSSSSSSKAGFSEAEIPPLNPYRMGSREEDDSVDDEEFEEGRRHLAQQNEFQEIVDDFEISPDSAVPISQFEAPGQVPPKRVADDLVIFDDAEEELGSMKLLGRAYIDSEKKRLLGKYGVELQELYDKRVSPETIEKIFGTGKTVVAELMAYFRDLSH